MPFILDFDGEQIRTDDLTLDEAKWVEKETGTAWIYLRPVADAGHALALLTVLNQRRGLTLDEARLKAGRMTIRQLLAMTEYVEEDLPSEYVDGIPKAEGGPSTSGSSGPVDGSTGPRT